MKLIINGEVVKVWRNVGKTEQVYSYQHPEHLVKGTNVRVAFTNDAHIPGIGDRNLIVNKIVVDGDTYQTESPKVYSKGVWRQSDGCAPGFKESQKLSCNGYFLYFIR
jgi:hypothetical protein